MRLAAAAALCLLCGCSMVRLAYDNAEAYLRWRTSAYLDVHGTQAEALDAAIAGFVAWHRAHALPQYARLAEEAARRVGDGVSRSELAWGYDSLLAQARESLRAAAQRIAPLAARLDASQIAYLESRLAEDNQRFAREHLRGSEGERRRRRAERIAERLEDWVGTLSQAQIERIRRYSDTAPLLAEMRDRDNRRLQAGLLALLRSGEVENSLPGFVLAWRDGRDPAYAAAIESARRELFAMLLDIDRTLSAGQRAEAAARLQRFAADFRRLAGQL